MGVWGSVMGIGGGKRWGEGGGGGGERGGERDSLRNRRQITYSSHPLPYGSSQLYN